MYLFFILSAVFLVAAAQENLQSESEDKNRDEPDAYESFGAPVYGSAKSIAPKSGYAQVPPLPALPAAYAAYLNGLGYGSLGYGYNNAYNRFGILPYTAPYYNGLGAGYGLGYGYGAGPGYGYGAGLPYSNGYLGRSAAYNAYGYGGYPYAPAAGLGYRFGYNGAALRAPLAGPLPGGPAGALPAPVPAGVPAPLPAGLPATAAFRPPVFPQGKDGSYRYGYPSVAGQRLIWKK